MKTIKSLALAIMTIAAMALVSCNQNEPDSTPKPGQTEANVKAFYVTTADALKYCDMTFTSDGKAVEGTVKTLNETSMTTTQVNDVVALVDGFSTMTTDDIRIVELTSQKVSLGKHQVQVVLSRNATPTEDLEINMAHGFMLSSTDGIVTAPTSVHVYGGVNMAEGIDSEGENMLTLMNEAGTLEYTVNASK